MPTSRLFLIDGYSNLFRAFHAIRGLSNSKGEPTNAVYGFLNMLRKLLREEKPELIGVALDSSEPTVRSARFADYKANRAPMPPDLVPQIPRLRAAIAAYRIPILEYADYEADDVIGTLAKKAAAQGYEVVVVSADKDFFQLVGPGVSLYHTGREKLYGAAEVEADFGVPPERVVDVLALMGDAVDNVPGVPGIGDKGAKQLVREYGSLEQLLLRAAEIPRKAYREGLQQHREAALLSKELVTLHTDLPVPFDAEALRCDPPDTEALLALFSELEFFSLAEELRASAPAAVAAGAAIAAAEEVLTAADWRRHAATFTGALAVAAIGGDEPVGLAIGADEAVAFADFRRPEMRAAVEETLVTWFADPSRVLVGHDLKETLRLAPEAGAACRAELRDTMLASYLLNTALRSHGLGEVVLEKLGHRAITLREAGFERDMQPPPGDHRLLALAAERVALPWRMWPAMDAALAAALAAVLPAAALAAAGSGPALTTPISLRSVYTELEAPLIPVLLGMEETGIGLDVPFLHTMSVEMAEQLAALERDIYELAGETFNIASPPQLGAILFEKLALPVLGRTRKTKSYTTDAETLEELAVRGYPLPEKILRHREVAKLKSTYVDALPRLVGADGRLHTRYDQAVAATGRLSSVNPNLQNIPVRTEQGQRIRRAFRAAPGMLLLVADYNQIELRVLAHIAGEEALVETFRRGEDIHRSTAASVFGIAPELVSAEQRRAAKTINFGILYGMSAFGLGRNLGIPSGEAGRFINAYLDRFPKVRGYMDDTLAMAKRDGRVETLYGRARHLPDINSRNFPLRENARRMAINARIQGTAADLLKKAMIAVAGRLRAEQPQARLLLSVHDELVLEVPEAAVAAAALLVKTEMEQVAALAVPLAVDVGWGENWYAAKS
jgi:DNA polymerase I